MTKCFRRWNTPQTNECPRLYPFCASLTVSLTHDFLIANAHLQLILEQNKIRLWQEYNWLLRQTQTHRSQGMSFEWMHIVSKTSIRAQYHQDNNVNLYIVIMNSHCMMETKIPTPTASMHTEHCSGCNLAVWFYCCSELCLDFQGGTGAARADDTASD
jgi:hypothetical protein